MWHHPSRLPLGWGWRGYCTAPGHEGEVPTDEQLHEGCNLGYAKNCPRWPKDRLFDCVRFGLIRQSDERVVIGYVYERNHCPGEHGTLEYNIAQGGWISAHSDARVQKMAECYLAAYLLGKSRSAGIATTS